MILEKPTHTFNVCDNSGTTYEVQVFEGILTTNLDKDIKNSKVEFMFLNGEHLLIENGTDVFMAGIDMEFKEFRLC